MGSYVDCKADAGSCRSAKSGGALHKPTILLRWQCMGQCMSLCSLPVTVTSFGGGACGWVAGVGTVKHFKE